MTGTSYSSGMSLYSPKASWLRGILPGVSISHSDVALELFDCEAC